MKKIFLSIALIGGILNAGNAQEKVDDGAIQKIRTEGLQKSQVMKTAFYLTDVSGPRLSNSPGLKRSQDWAVNTLKSYGLQNVKAEPWGKFGKGWQIDKSYTAMTAPYYAQIIASPKAWTPGTNGIVRSEVVLLDISKVDTITKMDSFKGKLNGKIVIFDTPNTLVTTFKPDGSRYTEEELTELAAPPAPSSATNRPSFTPEMMAQLRKMRSMRTQISDFLKAENAAILLSYSRGSHGTHFTSNGASYAEDAPAVLPELEVAAEDYLRMIRLLKAGIKVEMEAEIKTSFYEKDLQGYNVVGEIPGTDPKLKNEIVMLGGHLDSWHAGTGATDNAAGCAVMMEAVRIIKAANLNPKRTIRIALWSSEEQGLHGSRNYVLNHFGDPRTMALKADHEKVSAYYNLDNGTGKVRGIYLQGNTEAGPIFKNWLSPFKDLGAQTVTIRNTGGTDHLAFDALGIPGFQFIQDEVEYGSRTHHSNMDTYDRLIEDDLKSSATIIAAFVYNTAQRDQKIPRKTLPAAQAAAR